MSNFGPSTTVSSNTTPLLVAPGVSLSSFATYATDANGNVVGLVGLNGSAAYIDAGLFGASPSATATVNTAAIQAALNSKGAVMLLAPGVYNITSNGLGTEILKMPSDTTLMLGAGVVVRGPATGTNVVPLIANSNWRSNKNSVTSITCTVSSAPFETTATVTETAHGRAVGDYVLIKGDTTGYYNDVWKIASVVDANTYTFKMYGFGVAPPNAAGTVISYAANANFKLLGSGVFDGQRNTTNAGVLGDLGKFGSMFNKVADYYIESTFVNTAKYGIQYCNSFRARFKTGTFATPSDGIHGNGPISQAIIEGLFGSTGDDCIAHTANNTNYTQYALRDADGTQNSDGDITDIEINSPIITVGGSRVFLFQTGQGLKVKRVTVRGIHKQSSLSGTYGLFDIQGAETGSFEDILIDGYYGNVLKDNAMLQIGTGTGTINVKNMMIRNIGSHGGDISGTSVGLTGAILGGSNSTVNLDGITLDGANVDFDLANATASPALLNLGGGSGLWTVNRLKASNCTVKGSGATRGASIVNLPGQFTDVLVTNCSIACNNSSLVQTTSSQTGTGVIQITNSYAAGDGVNNGQSLITASGAKPLNIQVANSYGLNQVNGGVYITGGSAMAFTIRLSGVEVSNKLIVNGGTSHTFNVWASAVSSPNFAQSGGNLIAVGTTSTWNFNGNCADIGIDVSTVTRKDGTILYNTNAALGTFVVAGLVSGQGNAANSWSLLSDPTKKY